MKKALLFGFAAVSMLIVGCTKDIDTDIVKNEIVRGELVTKTVVIDETRVERDEVSGKLTWNEGDEVSAILYSDGKYTLDTEKYSVKFVDGEAQLTIPNNTAYMFYPATTITAVSESGAATLNLLQTYTITTPEAIFNYSAMKGTVDGDFVTFNNLLGYLKVPLTGSETLNKLTVKSEIFNGFEPLSRTLGLDLTAEEVNFTLPSTNNEARAWVTIDFSQGLDLSTSPAVYVPVPARDYANLALVAITENGATSIYANNSHKVNRSKIKPVSTTAINVTTSTPAAPQPLNGDSGDSKEDYANTYIVPPTAGEYKFPCILADGTELAGGVTAEIVWAEEAGMFNNIHYNPSENTISFKTNGKEGNALIALSKKVGDTKTIVWSWLLWCTDAPETIAIKAKDNNATYKVLDRVIGATWAPTGTLADERANRGWSTTDMPYKMNGSVSSQDATDGCGLYYQYQNMIPYPRIKNIDATTTEANPDGKADHSLTNTRIAVQYGFHQYCQYWTSSGSCSTVTQDDNGQYRTAASYNLSYQYAAGNNAWCFTPLMGGSGVAEVNGVLTRLWGGSSSAACSKANKTTHDPCPAGYIIEDISGLYHYLGASSPTTIAGYVRNPENSDVHSGTTGYKFYGMYITGGTNSKGVATDIYTPCCSNRNQTVCRTIGSYANMGYLYTFNSNNNGKVAFDYTYGDNNYTGYYAANNQFGAAGKNAEGTAGCGISSPWGWNTKKITNAQAYPVRCRKFGN